MPGLDGADGVAGDAHQLRQLRLGQAGAAPGPAAAGCGSTSLSSMHPPHAPGHIPDQAHQARQPVPMLIQRNPVSRAARYRDHAPTEQKQNSRRGNIAKGQAPPRLIEHQQQRKQEHRPEPSVIPPPIDLLPAFIPHPPAGICAKSLPVSCTPTSEVAKFTLHLQYSIAKLTCQAGRHLFSPVPVQSGFRPCIYRPRTLWHNKQREERSASEPSLAGHCTGNL